MDSADHIDEKKRHLLINTAATLGGLGLLAATVPFITSWFPSAKARAAAAPVEVDVSRLTPGAMLTVEWRGKPIWVVHRTPAMLKTLQGHDAALRDPNSLVDQQPPYAQNAYRSIKPEYLVLVGICTHLGCSPSYYPQPASLNPQWLGGFFCPCHGSTFDLSGRVFKGVPAPVNLEVPVYGYLSETRLVIGQHHDEHALPVGA